MESYQDKIHTATTWCSRFFTLVVGVIQALFLFIYCIGVLRYVHGVGRFERLEVAHFLAAALAVTTLALYLPLHFLPKKRIRILTALSVLHMLSISFVSHSMGVTAPTVDDCDEDAAAFTGKLVDELREVVPANHSATLGRLGQSLDRCGDQTVIFAGALLLIGTQFVALFDVQRMLLTRIRAKTYGDRFVEMGVA